MKNILICVLLFSSSLIAKNILKGSIILESDTYKTTGNISRKKNSTFLSEKLRLNYLNKVKDYQYGFMINAKKFKNKYNNKDIAEVTKLRIFYANKTFNLEFGDVANTLNPYVYNGSIKGMKINRFFGNRKNEGLNLFFISGYKIKKWEDAFKTHKNITNGMASEAKYLFSRYKYLSLSASNAKIDESGKTSKIIGFQCRWRFNRKVTLKTHTALAKVKKDSNISSENSKAFKLEMNFKPQRYFKAKVKYEIVDTNYDVLFGKASKDREKFQGNFDFKFRKGTYFKILFKKYRDNIDGSLGESRYTTDKKATFSMKPKILSRGTFSLLLQKKLRDGRGIDTLLTIKGIKINKYINKNLILLSSYQTRKNKNNLNGEYILKSNNIKFGTKLKGKISKYKRFNLSILLNKGKYIYTSRTKERLGFKLDGRYIFNKSFYLKFLASKKQNDVEKSKTINNIFSLSGNYKLKTLFNQNLNFLLEKKTYSKSDSNDRNYNQYRAKLTYKLNF